MHDRVSARTYIYRKDFEESGWVFAVLLLYLFSFVAEAPIRYLLHLIGAEPLLYLRDAALLALVAIYFIKKLSVWKMNTFVLVATAVIGYFSVIGLIYIKSLAMVAFGIKILLPVMSGIIFFKSIMKRMETFKIFVTLFFLIAVAGLIWDIYAVLPWESLTYKLGEFDVLAVKTEYIPGGFDRNTGFAGNPQKAADQIMFFGFLLFALARNLGRKTVLYILIGIILSRIRVKSLMAAYILTLPIVLTPRTPTFRSIGKFYKIGLIVPLLIMIAVPMLGHLPYFDSLIYDESYEILFGSFRERLVGTWPAAFSLASEHGNKYLGRGIGGLGGGQAFFEPNLYNPGDNLFVHLYVMVGVFSIVILFYLYWRSQSLELRRYDMDYFVFLFIYIVFFYGLASSGLEDGVMAILYGFVLRYLSSMKYTSWGNIPFEIQSV